MAMEPEGKMQTLALDSTNNASLEPDKSTQKGSQEGQRPTTVAELEKNVEPLTEEKLQVQTQTSLEEKMKCLICERDALRRDLNSKSDKAEALFNEVVELERINDRCLLDLKNLYLEHRGLALESTSIVSGVLETNSGLEERLRRNTRRTQMFLERVFEVLKSSIDLMGVCEVDKEDMEKEEEDVKGEVIGDEVQEMEDEIIMIQRYESKLKAMEMALIKRREGKMELEGME